MNIPCNPKSADEPLLRRLLFFASRHHEQGHLDAARDFLELATLVDPQNTDYLDAFGAVCGQTGEWPHARQVFTELTRLKPRD